jgi:hypothetical protein
VAASKAVKGWLTPWPDRAFGPRRRFVDSSMFGRSVTLAREPRTMQGSNNPMVIRGFARPAPSRAAHRLLDS